MRYGEVQIVLSPVGVDRTELRALPGDEESKEAAVEIYQRLAMEIHRFSRQAKEILRGQAVDSESQ